MVHRDPVCMVFFNQAAAKSCWDGPYNETRIRLGWGGFSPNDCKHIVVMWTI